MSDPTPHALLMFGRALRLRCPNCGQGKPFVSSFRMRSQCEVCGLAFERGEDGYQVGSYMFNIVASELVFAAVFLAIVLLIFDPEVADFLRAVAFRRESFRGDLLFSYQPNPGTVLFAGYGSTLRDPVDPEEPLRTGLRRADDGFFFKMSYLFRM